MLEVCAFPTVHEPSTKIYTLEVIGCSRSAIEDTKSSVYPRVVQQYRVVINFSS